MPFRCPPIRLGRAIPIAYYDEEAVVMPGKKIVSNWLLRECLSQSPQRECRRSGRQKEVGLSCDVSVELLVCCRCI